MSKKANAAAAIWPVFKSYNAALEHHSLGWAFATLANGKWTEWSVGPAKFIGNPAFAGIFATGTVGTAVNAVTSVNNIRKWFQKDDNGEKKVSGYDVTKSMIATISATPALVTILGSTINCFTNTEFFLNNNPHFFTAALVTVGLLKAEDLIRLALGYNSPEYKAMSKYKKGEYLMRITEDGLAILGCATGAASLQGAAEKMDYPVICKVPKAFITPAVTFNLLAACEGLHATVEAGVKIFSPVERSSILNDANVNSSGYGTWLDEGETTDPDEFDEEAAVESDNEGSTAGLV